VFGSASPEVWQISSSAGGKERQTAKPLALKAGSASQQTMVRMRCFPSIWNVALNAFRTRHFADRGVLEVLRSNYRIARALMDFLRDWYCILDSFGAL
jgi:hypothetical protein